LPDEAIAEGLIETARSLVHADKAEHSQADVRCAISTAYFAMYHALARMSANGLVGSDRTTRANKAWVEVYRGLAHGVCKDSCKKAVKIAFPEELKFFASNFVTLQTCRKRADYDPVCRPSVDEASQLIEVAALSIELLGGVDDASKTAFATWVLISSPGAKAARTVVSENNGRSLGLGA